MTDQWYALVIGNSRLHWARFSGENLEASWHEPHGKKGEGEWQMARGAKGGEEIWIASVVPELSQKWADDWHARFLSLSDVPIQGMYPTLGIDRALALWGAIVTVGSPVLVIDGGTALTFTGADSNRRLVGGAILPGLRLQFEALGRNTAVLHALPQNPRFSAPFPPSSPRWAMDTEAAIASGILYTITSGIQSFIQDWWRQFPESRVVLTGGDRDVFYQCVWAENPAFANLLTVDEHLVYKGIQSVRAMIRSQQSVGFEHSNG